MKPEHIEELIKIHEKAIRVVDANKEDLSWSRKYNYVFSDSCSKRVSEITGGLDYYDPDADFEDDVRAYMAAFAEEVDKIKLLQQILEGAE